MRPGKSDAGGIRKVRPLGVAWPWFSLTASWPRDSQVISFPCQSFSEYNNPSTLAVLFSLIHIIFCFSSLQPSRRPHTWWARGRKCRKIWVKLICWFNSSRFNPFRQMSFGEENKKDMKLGTWLWTSSFLLISFYLIGVIVSLSPNMRKWSLWHDVGEMLTEKSHVIIQGRGGRLLGIYLTSE